MGVFGMRHIITIVLLSFTLFSFAQVKETVVIPYDIGSAVYVSMEEITKVEAVDIARHLARNCIKYDDDMNTWIFNKAVAELYPYKRPSCLIIMLTFNKGTKNEFYNYLVLIDGILYGYRNG